MGGLVAQRTVVAAKLEAVEGTEIALADADGFLAYEAKFEPLIEMNQRDPHRATLDPAISLAGKHSGKFTFKTELVGASAAGTAPFWGKLIKACGAAETIVADTSVTYAPASTDIPTLTIALYRDGKKKVGWGCRGTWKLELENGKPGMIAWEFTCAGFEESDVALLSPTYGATLPPVLLSATVTLDAYAVLFEKIGIDVGNTVMLRVDPSKATGHVSALITNRRPILTIDPEAVLVATKDWVTIWQTDEGQPFSAALGSVAGNTITISAPAARLEKMEEGDRTGLLTDQMTAVLGYDSGDDCWEIAIT